MKLSNNCYICPLECNTTDNMPSISQKASAMPASAIRKFVPLADAAKAAGTKVYHLNIGAPDIKSPECALNAVVEKCKTLDHLSYSHSAGLMELRKGLVEKYYRKIGIDIDLSEILIQVAGSEAFSIAMDITCDRGDEIIVFEPYYTNYNTFAYLYGITLKAVHTDIHQDFALPSIEEMEKLVSPRTKAVLISNPSNPSGTLFSRADLEKIGELCRKHDLFLISDEVYREYCFTEEPHFSAINLPGMDQHVILVDSVSKRYNLCGARIGTIISHNKEVMATVMKYDQSRLCAPVLGQYASIGALDTPDEYFEETAKEYIKRRDVTIDALNAMPGVYAPRPKGAFYAIAELPVDDAELFVQWMLSEFRLDGSTTMVTPVASFYSTPDAGRNQVRIAYVLEVPELEKAMKVLAAGLQAYPGRTV